MERQIDDAMGELENDQENLVDTITSDFSLGREGPWAHGIRALWWSIEMTWEERKERLKGIKTVHRAIVNGPVSMLSSEIDDKLWSCEPDETLLPWHTSDLSEQFKWFGDGGSEIVVLDAFTAIPILAGIDPEAMLTDWEGVIDG